jgi:hypothetical protein
VNNTIKNNALKALLINFFIAQTPDQKITGADDERVVQCSQRSIEDSFGANPFIEDIFAKLYLNSNGQLTPYGRSLATRMLNLSNNNFINFSHVFSNLNTCLAGLGFIIEFLNNELKEGKIEKLNPNVMKLIENSTNVLSLYEDLPVEQPSTEEVVEV